MMAAIVLLLVAAAGFGVYSLFFAQRRTPFQSITITKVSGTHNARLGAMSPDRNYLAYVRNDDGNESLWLRHLASESNVQIVPPQNVQFAALRFAPDGGHIYYSHTELASGPASREYDLYRVPVLGGTPQLLVKDVDTNPSFSPDGQHFVFARANDPEPGKYFVVVASADGTDEKTISSGSMSKPLGQLAWAPDGKTIAGLLYEPYQDSIMAVVGIDPNTGKQQVISRPASAALSGVAWLPDGKDIVVTFSGPETSLNRQQIALISYPDGKFRPITADTNDYGNISISSDGATIATVMGQSIRDLYLSSGQKPDYSDIKQVTSGDPVQDVAWTNDGKLLADEMPITRILGTDGGQKGEINPEKDGAAIEPNGCGPDHIVFTRGSFKTESMNIWASETDGTRWSQISDGKNDQDATCSPDGKAVFYVDIFGGKYMKVPFAGGKAERFTAFFPETDSLYDIARDGKTALLGTYDFKAQKPNFALVSIDSGQVLRSFDYDVRHRGTLRFSPDGKSAVYPIREKGVSNLWLQPLDGGPGHQLTNFTSLKIYSYQWTSDGKGLALVRGDSPSDLVLIHDAQKK